MPEQSTLSYVADLVIQKVLMDADTPADLGEALERAYPFDNSPHSRQIWMDALLRHTGQPAPVPRIGISRRATTPRREDDTSRA